MVVPTVDALEDENCEGRYFWNLDFACEIVALRVALWFRELDGSYTE